MKNLLMASAFSTVMLLSSAAFADDQVGDDNDELTADSQPFISPDAYVCFFEHADYKGKKTCYTQDIHNTYHPGRLETNVTKSVDDTFSSVKVGKAITVRGCQNHGDTSYYCKRFFGDINYLGDDWNDVISAVTVDKFKPVPPVPIIRDPDFTDAYSLDDENHLMNAKESPDSMRPSICLYSEINYGGDEKCFHGDGPLDTEQDNWVERTASYRIALGYILCGPDTPAAPKPEGQDYDSATTGCEIHFKPNASYSQISTYRGKFRGLHIEKNSQFKRYM